MFVGRKVYLTLLTGPGAGDGHHLLAHAARAAFGFDVIAVGDRAAERAGGVAGFGEAGRVEAQFVLRACLDDLEADLFLTPRRDHLQRDVAVVFLAEPCLFQQRNSGFAVGVLAGDGARPEIGDRHQVAGGNFGFRISDFGLGTGLECHLCIDGKCHCLLRWFKHCRRCASLRLFVAVKFGIGDERVEVTDLGFDFVQHPLAPVADFVGQPAPSRLTIFSFWAGHAAGGRVGFAVFLRIDQRAKLDDVGDGIEVECICLAPQPQRFQRNRAAPRKHIQHLRTRRFARNDVLDRDLLAGLVGQPFRVRFEDVLLRLRDDGRIARILAEPLDKFRRVGPSETFFLRVRPVVGHEPRGRYQRPIHRCPASHQWPPRPPQM